MDVLLIEYGIHGPVTMPPLVVARIDRMSVNLTPFAEGPQTASAAGLSASERRQALKQGLLEPVVRRGEAVTVRTGSRGRPAGLLRLTRKGRRAVA